MIDVKRTTIQIPKDMLIEIKAMAIKQGTTQNTIITNLLAKGMEKTKKKGKIKAKVINHKIPGYDPDKKLNSMSLIGIVKVDDDEKIDDQELKDSIHFKKELY